MTSTSSSADTATAHDDITGRLLAAYDAQLRGWAEALPPGAWKEQDGPLLRVVGMRQGFLLGPRELGVNGAELEELIERQRAYFAARGEPVEWKTHSHDLPADLPGRLRAAGFTPEPPETIVVADAERIAALAPRLAPEVTLRSVTELPDLRRLVAMQAAAFGRQRPWRAEELARQLAAAPETAVLVAEVNGEIVSGARLTIDTGTDFAGLWGGATLAEWRGRGIYRALVAERARLAAARGTRYVYVDASADSAPILRRLGFHAITTTTPYVLTPT